jgi:hypothetical protein
MRGLLTTLATLVLPGAAATPVAYASPTDPTFAEVTHINDLHALGIADRAGFSDMVTVGWWVCNKLTDRASVATVTRQIYSGASGAISYSQAVWIVRYAVADLCPQKSALL